MRRTTTNRRHIGKAAPGLLAACAFIAFYVLSGAARLQAQSGQTDPSDKQQATPALAGQSPANPSSNPAPSTNPTPVTPARQQTSAAKTKGMVWVNTESGVYHKPGTRWYGKTKQGKFMLEADAIKAGYKLAK